MNKPSDRNTLQAMKQAQEAAIGQQPEHSVSFSCPQRTPSASASSSLENPHPAIYSKQKEGTVSFASVRLDKGVSGAPSNSRGRKVTRTQTRASTPHPKKNLIAFKTTSIDTSPPKVFILPKPDAVPLLKPNSSSRSSLAGGLASAVAPHVASGSSNLPKDSHALIQAYSGLPETFPISPSCNQDPKKARFKSPAPVKPNGPVAASKQLEPLDVVCSQPFLSGATLAGPSDVPKEPGTAKKIYDVWTSNSPSPDKYDDLMNCPMVLTPCSSATAEPIAFTRNLFLYGNVPKNVCQLCYGLVGHVATGKEVCLSCAEEVVELVQEFSHLHSDESPEGADGLPRTLFAKDGAPTTQEVLDGGVLVDVETSVIDNFKKLPKNIRQPSSKRKDPLGSGMRGVTVYVAVYKQHGESDYRGMHQFDSTWPTVDLALKRMLFLYVAKNGWSKEAWTTTLLETNEEENKQYMVFLPTGEYWVTSFMQDKEFHNFAPAASIVRNKVETDAVDHVAQWQCANANSPGDKDNSASSLADNEPTENPGLPYRGVRTRRVIRRPNKLV